MDLRAAECNHLMSRTASPHATRRRVLQGLGAAAAILPLDPGLLHAAAELPFVEVASGIYVRHGVQEELSAANGGAIANIGFIIGADSVAVIDSGATRQQGEAVLRAVAAVTDRPVSHLIATHVHLDHCFGHAAFDTGSLVSLGHHRLPRALAERGPFYLERIHALSPDFASTTFVPPTRTVEDTLTIDLGNRLIELAAWPAAHTDNDLTVFDHRTKTLWAADLLFDARLPTLDGSLLGWLEVLDRLITPDVDLVVPGHGGISDGRATLARQRGYLAAIRDGVRDALDDGLDIPATLRRLEDTGRADWLLFDAFHGRNIVTAYTELEWE
ncbi:quinoprotein relay system zinc metallohydrolase 2 [Breoghania sp. L-A4]|uniref:quinoprotein relay system zinc metallohydrolase 2 n=1 Tax=Breoghania sp. L-A4 TaxID=2304600 RepID=UPI0013C34CF6|nr:quinoprotein relay system zinc metallohydrolase 2 [Breoghania sp. L-A4]